MKIFYLWIWRLDWKILEERQESEGGGGGGSNKKEMWCRDALQSSSGGKDADLNLIRLHFFFWDAIVECRLCIWLSPPYHAWRFYINHLRGKVYHLRGGEMELKKSPISSFIFILSHRYLFSAELISHSLSSKLVEMLRLEMRYNLIFLSD